VKRVFACLTIVAGFPLHLAAAAAVSEDVPVPGGAAAFAQSLGIDPVPDRGRFMYEVTRLVFDNDPQRSPERLALRFGFATPADARATKNGRQASLSDDRGSRRASLSGEPGRSSANDLVPVPLTADFWSDHVFHRKVSRDDLVAAIVSDRQAALLCHGLTSLDDETLQFIGEHGSLLSRLSERSRRRCECTEIASCRRARRARPTRAPPQPNGMTCRRCGRPSSSRR
jgi:hypothetical protein